MNFFKLIAKYKQVKKLTEETLQIMEQAKKELLKISLPMYEKVDILIKKWKELLN